MYLSFALCYFYLKYSWPLASVFKTSDVHGHCRWSTNINESFVFVKYNGQLLNILDVEKKVLTLKTPVELAGNHLSSLSV